MKFFKFLLLTAICSFMSLITPTYAVVSSHYASSSVSMAKKVSLKTKLAKQTSKYRLGIFDNDRKLEAIVMGSFALVMAVLFGYIFFSIILAGIFKIIIGILFGCFSLLTITYAYRLFRH